MTTEDFNIYPNPTTGLINVDYTGDKEIEAAFILYDLLGNKVFSKTLINGDAIINWPSIANGVYTYTISTTKEIIKRDKLILDR